MKRKIEEKKISKIISLLNKKMIAFCEEIGLSIRPTAKLSQILSYQKKNPSAFKVGKVVDFEKVGSDSIGRNERAFFVEFQNISFFPKSYKTSYDNKGKKTGVNMKEYTKAEVVKA